eukprot:1195691-Prorocentrum_minimum.AAC.4
MSGSNPNDRCARGTGRPILGISTGRSFHRSCSASRGSSLLRGGRFASNRRIDSRRVGRRAFYRIRRLEYTLPRLVGRLTNSPAGKLP